MMLKFLPAAFILLIFNCLTSYTNSINAQPNLTFTSKITGLDFPVAIVNADDGSDRLFIVEQPGKIKLYNGLLPLTTFLDLTSTVTYNNDERGLLSLVFHPNYNGTTNRYFFVYYTTTSGSITSINIARYETVNGNANAGDINSGVPVLTIPKPSGRTNHNGGDMHFGADGMLYISTGDGGSGNDPDNLAQSGTSLLGKMLRININGSAGSTPYYSIPADNPYAADGDGFLNEIWAYGLRNPFRWSFDRQTHDMWIADVGQNAREEVNFRSNGNTAGVNYGWRCMEGKIATPTLPSADACDPPNDVLPVFDYGHNNTTGGFSITGGYVYRGALYPNLNGVYIFSDYVSGNAWVMVLNNSGQGVADLKNTLPGSIAGFGEDEDGELYAVSRGGALGQGVVYSVSSSGGSFVLPITLLNFTAKNFSGYNELTWKTAFEQNADRFIIEYSTDGISFQPAGSIKAFNNGNGAFYNYRHYITNRKIYYRLQLHDLDGSIKYSAIISTGGANRKEHVIYSTIIKNNLLEVNSGEGLEYLSIYSTDGREVFSKNISGVQGYFSVQLPALSKGIYFVNLKGRNVYKTEKIVVQQ